MNVCGQFAGKKNQNSINLARPVLLPAKQSNWQAAYSYIFDLLLNI